ncbi:Lrp/AsnC family transcriptional regulator [Yinghuangia seranimata]|uniref:Lrp/AsnC family transcriptional regulator n=1 Tax=Yinghuangia seranimata TaxID=408067 RepID=UPI00248D33F9|nr:Lrp/AsnC family transcriptional regulator [Yinghuangia seranimata]MDI2128556.1 Lrp/AsnC family transcriptional regulator [Yinghuangia seranimata]
MESVITLDDLDKALIHALEVDGRASFARIARVLDVSEQTVARRYRRLRGAGAIRVVGVVNPARLGAVLWLVRLRSTPDAAWAIAEALARRDETSWVELSAGGTEIGCLVRAHAGESGDELLRHALPRTPNVVDISAQCVLHVAFALSWRRKRMALTDDQVAELRAGHSASYGPWAPIPSDRPAVPLEETDLRLLNALAVDGRTGFAELAAATGLSETAVRRRLDQLRAEKGVVFEVDLDCTLFGHHVTAMMRMSVPPKDLTAVMAALSEHPEIVFVGATTGQTNVVASVVCRDERDLFRYMSTELAALEQVAWVESSTTFRQFKREGAVLPGSPGRRVGPTGGTGGTHSRANASAKAPRRPRPTRPVP